MLPQKIRSRTSRQRVLLSPSITSSTQATIESTAAPNAFNLETVSLSRQLKEVLTKSSELHQEVSPLHNKLRSFQTGVETLASALPSLSWFLIDLASVIDAVLAEARETHQHLMEKTLCVGSMSQKLEDAFERVRMLCTDEIKQSLVVTGLRDSEIQAVSDLCETLTNRLKNVESENADLRRSMKRMVTRDAEHDRESDMRRSQLAELQSKSLVIVQENQYLRQICRHNRDLLNESSELRDEIDRLNIAHKADIEKAVRDREGANKEIENLTLALRQVGKQLENNERDLADAKEGLALCEQELQQSFSQQHFFLGSHTPRPKRGADVAAAIQFARTVLGDVVNQKPGQSTPTALVEQSLVQLVSRLCEMAQQQKSRAESQATVLQYMAFDDFEQMTRGVASSLVSFCGSGALPPANEGLVLQALAPTPLHSKVVLGQGMWHDMKALSSEPLCIGPGWYGVRTFSLEELILTLDEIRLERRSPNNQSGSLIQHVRRYASQRNSGSTAAQNDFLSSIDYSLDLHCYSPVVDMFRRTMREDAFPEALHFEIISALDQLCKDIAGLPAEFLHPGSIGKTAVKLLSKKALMAAVGKNFPNISDNIMFRLRGVLQAESLRLAGQDAKVAATIFAKDECIAESIIGSPQGDDISSPFVVVTGTAQRSSQSTSFRRPLSSLLMPFSAALYRFAVDQYESFAMLVASIGCGVAVDGRLTHEALRVALLNVFDDNVVVTEFVNYCCAGNSASMSMSEYGRCVRAFYFPPHLRNKGDQPPVAPDVKVVDLTRKSVVLLRSLQR